MSRGYCNICGSEGVGVHLYPGLRRLARIKALTVAKPFNPKQPEAHATNNFAHEPCYRNLEKLAAARKDVNPEPLFNRSRY